MRLIRSLSNTAIALATICFVTAGCGDKAGSDSAKNDTTNATTSGVASDASSGASTSAPGAEIAATPTLPGFDRSFDNPPTKFIIEPDLRIGGSEKQDEIITRVSGIKIDKNGTIFMVQPDDKTIRVYDAKGKFLRTMGRPGQGPGEFTGFGYFGFNHDSLWVTDPSQDRVSLFGPDGKIIRYLRTSVNPPSAIYGAAPPLTYMQDGSLLVRFVGAQEDIVTDTTRPPDLLMRASADGVLKDTVRIFPMPAYKTYKMGTRDVVAPRPINNYPYVVFAPDGSQAVIVERDPPKNPDSATFTVVRVGADGKIISEVKYGYTPRRIPKKVIDSLLPLAPDSAPAAMRETYKARRENAQLPPYLPPINLTIVGRDGTIWIASAWAENRYRWTIIDARNKIIGTADVPAGFRALQADMEHVWGTEADSNDVPYVVRYRVKRSGG